MRYSVILLGFAMFCALATKAFSQGVPSIEAGSAESARYLADLDRLRVQAQIKRNAAKKLKITEKQYPDHEDTMCLGFDTLEIGSVGFLDCVVFSVVQICGESEALIGHEGAKSTMFWLSKYPTKKLADGDDVILQGYVEVTGSKSYETVAGSTKTIWVLEFVHADREAELDREMEEKQEAKERRTWSDISGKHKIEAKFLGMKSNLVMLKTKDGTTKEIQLSKLSRTDQTWIRDELKKNRQSKEKSQSQK